MFAWIIDGKLAKAAYADVLPEGIEHIVIAAEYAEAKYPLVDEAVSTPAQFLNFAQAVLEGLAKITAQKPVCFICQQGRSRSVAVICCIAAIFSARKYQEVFEDLLTRDSDLAKPSNILLVASAVCPYLF